MIMVCPYDSVDLHDPRHDPNFDPLAYNNTGSGSMIELAHVLVTDSISSGSSVRG